jgi:hypothetical protein
VVEGDRGVQQTFSSSPAMNSSQQGLVLPGEAIAPMHTRVISIGLGACPTR